MNGQQIRAEVERAIDALENMPSGGIADWRGDEDGLQAALLGADSHYAVLADDASYDQACRAWLILRRLMQRLEKENGDERHP